LVLQDRRLFIFSLSRRWAWNLEASGYLGWFAKLLGRVRKKKAGVLPAFFLP
jgi:hypothetical protein